MILTSTSTIIAQASGDLPLPYPLYFDDFTSGKLFFIQDSIAPFEAFSIPYSIFAYSWSPNGNNLAIIRNNSDTRTKLLEVFNEDFHLIQQLRVMTYQNDLFHFPIAWSGNDHILLISPSDTGVPQVLRMSLNSPEEITRLTIPVVESEELVQIYWSPDGRYMLYQTHTLSSPTPAPTNTPPIRQPEPHKLYLLELETLHSTLITESSFQGCVAWSPDNRLIASISDSFRDTEYPYMLRVNQLEIYDLGSFVEEIDLSIDLTHSLGCPIAWANDGKQIALETTRVDNENHYESGVAVIDIVSGEFQTVGISHLESYNIISLTWSPDDSWIAVETLYNAFRDIRLFSYDSGLEVKITLDGLPLFNPSWRFVEE